MYFFTFFNPVPVNSGIVYGTSKTLKINVTVTGTEPVYTYDVAFYNGLDDSIIGSTVSGVTNGSQAQSNGLFLTPSGIQYIWYVKAFVDGDEQISNIYTFNNKFLCHGWAEDQGTRISGVPIRLYKRDTGEFVGSTTTTGIDGTFSIESLFNEYHYAIALYESDDKNALIYDWLLPE